MACTLNFSAITFTSDRDVISFWPYWQFFEHRQAQTELDLFQCWLMAKCFFVLGNKQYCCLFIFKLFKVCTVEYVRAWVTKFSGYKSTVLVKALRNFSVNMLFELLYKIRFSSLTIKLIKQMHTDKNSQSPVVGWKDSVILTIYCHVINAKCVSIEEMQSMSAEQQHSTHTYYSLVGKEGFYLLFFPLSSCALPFALR